MTLSSLAALWLASLTHHDKPSPLDPDGTPRWEKTAAEQQFLRQEERHRTDLRLMVHRPY